MSTSHKQTMLKLLVLPCLFFSLFSPSSAQSCTKHCFSGNRAFSSCVDLPVLNSFHWTYDPLLGTLRTAYRHYGLTSSRWVSWAINPNSTGMVGAQALVAYFRSDGTLKAYTSSIAGYQTQLKESNLSFGVSDLSATYSGGEITIFATLQVPEKKTRVNQVWQEGPVVGGAPGRHDLSGANVQSFGSLNLVTGESGTAGGGGNSGLRRRNIHGVLNAVSWGILMPIGVLIARYLKVFADPAWFYLHAGCQTSAYIIGVAGFATGLKLGSETPGVTYSSHRTIGIILFCLATLQVFALFLRPNKYHKLRFYWNIYHHSVGYTVIILGIVNIFIGLGILDPEGKWWSAYIGVLVTLGITALSLEAYTWYIRHQWSKWVGA
ncbi:cytochrome b561 and DOMON domain-containing protein At5g47530-like [Malania oleifera]|uniref:cytochrome b561 and DOMON domain-containing protein At5g47530-like n=1 Tax=Malania oleifera TaxID=397392 RepID=UPI0025AE492B|nr:cytochrome b561 and DOMON domain-containing protein At5g47530-like [Malania oleifera]